jgi:CHAT domain-containing protein
MRCRHASLQLSFIAALVWVAVGCSGSEPPADASASAPPADPEETREACYASYPELAPCQDFVVEWVRGERAAELFEELDELRRERGDWTASYLTGFAHYISGTPEDRLPSIAHFEEADRLAEAAGEPAGRGQSLLMLGAVAEFQDGHVEHALRHYLQAVEQADAADDDALYVQCAWAVATIYPELGRYTDQIDWLNRALDRLGEEGDPSRRRVLLYALGNVHRKLGDWNSAKRYLEQDLESAVRDDDTYEEALALQMLGNVEMDRDPAASIPWFERCAVRAAAAELTSIRAHCEVLIGVAMVQADRLEEGRERLQATLERSLAIAEGDVEFTVQGLSNLLFLAEAHRRLGDPEPALELYRRARARAEEWRKPYFQWQVSAGLAALHVGQRHYDDAIREARRGVAEVESLRASIEDEAKRVYYLRQRSNVYTTLASALALREPDALENPFETLERVHSRTLREVLSDRFDTGPGADAASLAEIQTRLTPGDVLVEYLLGEDESLAMVVTPRAARLHRLPSRKRIEELVEAYRAALQRPLVSLDARLDPEADFRRTGAAGTELFEILLGPASGELADADRLIIVPDKQLHRLPFGTLPQKDADQSAPRFVAESYAILYLPAASFLTGQRVTRVGDVVVLAAASAQPALGLAGLSAAATEVESIRGSYPHSALHILEDGAATHAGLQAALDGPVRVLHIAGHAVLDPTAGPQVVLSADTPEGYRLLTIEEILGLAPTPPLVVLSACETGEGELVGGEGILGLVRAFRLAGSEQTVASLWKADDAAAASLMGAFHARLQRGEAPSRALAQARRELLAGGFVHPFRWGAFVLYGAD